MALRVGDRNKAVDVTWTAVDLDLTTVSEVVLKVRMPGGGFAWWSWAIQPGATAGAMVTRHVLSPTRGDLQQAGVHAILGYFVHAGGERDVIPLEFEVLPAA